MSSHPTSGSFTVKSDQDGEWYDVEFRPDHEQIWSAQPKGFVAKFTGIDSLYHVEQIIRQSKSHELVRARNEGTIRFLGQVSRDTYFRYSQFNRPS